MSSLGLNASELQNVAGTLGETDANKFGNSADVEFQWAIKAYHHAETYFNLISSVDSKHLKLTRMDDVIYKLFREHFPDFNVDVLDEELLKTVAAKETWREFCEKFKGDVEDYNMGSLVRVDSGAEFSEKNSVLVVRIQFLAIEIARNREGYNEKIRKSKSS